MYLLIKKVALWSFSSAIIVLFILSVMNYNYIKGVLSMQIATYGLLAIFVGCLLLEFIPEYISPHAIVIMSYLFGIDITISTLTVLTGSLMGSGLGFAFGRYYGEDLVKDIIKPKNIEKFKKNLNKGGRIYVMISAVSPLPYVPVAFGALGITKKNFLYFGLFPRMAGIIILAMLLYLLF